MKTIDVDMRAQMKDLILTTELKYPVKIKNGWLVLLGLRLIGIGCWLAGITHNEEVVN